MFEWMKKKNSRSDKLWIGNNKTQNICEYIYIFFIYMNIEWKYIKEIGKCNWFFWIWPLGLAPWILVLGVNAYLLSFFNHCPFFPLLSLSQHLSVNSSCMLCILDCSFLKEKLLLNVCELPQPLLCIYQFIAFRKY